jgi:hypothetical protein
MVEFRDDLSVDDYVEITRGLHKLIPRHRGWAVTAVEIPLPEDQNLVLHLTRIRGDEDNDEDNKVIMLSFDYILRHFQGFGEIRSDEDGIQSV